MKLNCKRIDFTYTPGEEIFNFPEESGLPFIFDVEEELTADPAAMDVVGGMLDEAEQLAEKAKAAIKAALADEDSRYHSVVTCFMEFHRDDVGPDIAAELFPGTDPAKLSFAEMVDFLRLDRFGSHLCIPQFCRSRKRHAGSGGCKNSLCISRFPPPPRLSLK